MVRLRGIFQVFLLALIFAVGANGVVMASNDLMHQNNCVNSTSDDVQTNHVHQGHADHDDHHENAAPEHDHETCMMHACSAISLAGYGSVEMPITLSATLTGAEHELSPLQLADSFLRPPNT